MHFVAALDKSSIRAGVCLFEGVATGAADGYGRMTGKPAATLLHLGPGFANGVANLHNARRAATPIVNIVGDHASWHNRYDAPLMSDIMGICASGVRTGFIPAANAETAALRCRSRRGGGSGGAGTDRDLDLARRFRLGRSGRTGAGACRSESRACVRRCDGRSRGRARFATARRRMLLLRGPALLSRGPATRQVASRPKAARGMARDYFRRRASRAAPACRRSNAFPISPRILSRVFKGLEQLILVGASPPVTFFAYPGKPSWVTPEGCEIITLSHPHEDGVAALNAVAEAVGAPKERADRAQLERPDRRSGEFSAMTMGQIIARLLPENAIISEEAATCGREPDKVSAGKRTARHSRISPAVPSARRLPVATGAAIAAPDRKVVTVSGDGGAMYTLQSLWTQAREKLDVVTVICANRSYAILNVELTRVGANNAGPKALSMLDIGHPDLDWVAAWRAAWGSKRSARGLHTNSRALSKMR